MSLCSYSTKDAVFYLCSDLVTACSNCKVDALPVSPVGRVVVVESSNTAAVRAAILVAGVALCVAANVRNKTSVNSSSLGPADTVEKALLKGRETGSPIVCMYCWRRSGVFPGGAGEGWTTGLLGGGSC